MPVDVPRELDRAVNGKVSGQVSSCCRYGPSPITSSRTAGDGGLHCRQCAEYELDALLLQQVPNEDQLRWVCRGPWWPNVGADLDYLLRADNAALAPGRLHPRRHVPSHVRPADAQAVERVVDPVEQKGCRTARDIVDRPEDRAPDPTSRRSARPAAALSESMPTKMSIVGVLAPQQVENEVLRPGDWLGTSGATER